MSHETLPFDAVWTEGGEERRRGLVVRIKPTALHVYQDDMFTEQYEIMRVVEAAGHVRVAKPLWLEQDATILGAPFFIMEKKSGRVPISVPSYAQQGWLFEATPAQRRVLWEDSVRQLASIQKTKPADTPFLDTGAPGDGFDQEIDRWRRFIAWAGRRGRPLLYQQKVLDHLVANAPENRPEGIVWGDARIGNMMFGDDFRVVAVMDWEQTSHGGALHDLGWWMFSEQLRTFALGIPTLAGMGERAETVALWEEVSGCSAADLDWYITFAALKMSSLGANMSQDRDTSGKEPELYDTPLNRQLADLLGWPAPTASAFVR
jgi:aminoglycoside phosphotransferase (APT) family kinase protein